MSFAKARAALKAAANPQKARFLTGFFRSGPGEYAEGDRFIGVVVPDTRKVAKRFHDLSLSDLSRLLKSEIHEERLLALIVLTERFPKATEAGRREIYEFYLKHLDRVNNWDLVDCSAHYIVGAWLDGRSKAPVLKLAKSKDLWERRIAMVSCFHEIRAKRMSHPLRVARILLHDKHDLIHKAVGWMLRELGKRDGQAERAFLDEHAHVMPRTMLRYAIEKFSERERRRYMSMKFRKS